MKRPLVLALMIGFCLTSLGMADMIQQVWLNQGWIGDAEGVAILHENRRPGMDLDPAPDQENILTESWWDEGSSGLGDDYTANLWGWVTIPETGTYTWQTHGDDHHVLYVSSDESMDNLVEVTRIDGWTGTGEWAAGGNATRIPAQPPSFDYVKGETRAVYAIQLQGTGGHNFGIGWIRPGSTDIEYISEWVTNIAPSPEIAGSAVPGTGETDVVRNPVLGWTPGKYAATHNVYLGISVDDVTNASVVDPLDVLLIQGHGENSYDPGLILDFGQTYYWRVDEVNGAPDNTVFKGKIWSFTVEPFSVPIESVTATASSTAPGTGPEKTADGSGLDEQDQHSITATDMWLSGAGDPTPSIQYEFDKTYKLHEMWVWNSNQLIEPFVGFGAKDVTIETSVDGAAWSVVEGATLFNQGTGMANYAANTTVDFSGALARFVRITIHAGWGMMTQYGLSEVRFFSIPTAARRPDPADGATIAGADVQLSWRAGREAASHEVYLGTDAGDLPLVGTTTETSFDAGALNFSTTYYWSITEVNEAEAVSAYAGDTWSLTTADYGIVDDFEQYNDNCNRIFFAWEDGLGHNGGTEIEDCDVAPSNGNGGGSIVGHNQAPFGERTIVNAGSRQSLPIEYDNAFGQSEATLSLGAQDWTASGIQTLSLMFRGIAGNTGTLYVKINNTKVLYDLNPADIARAVWQAWNIDLTGMAGLQNVTELTIGIDGASAAGMLYIDDIRLYPLPGELITPAEPTTGLLAHYNLDNNTNDDSGRGHHGVVVGDARFANDADRGGVVSFNGSDALVTVPHAAELSFGASDAYSISAWVHPSSVTGSWTGVVTKSRDVSPWYGIWIDGGNNWTFGHDGDNLAGSTAVAGVWTHVAVTYDNGQKRIYLNGTLDDEGTSSIDGSGTGDLVIGGVLGVSEFFEGWIDEVSVYSRALSGAEILWLADITEPIHKPF